MEEKSKYGNQLIRVELQTLRKSETRAYPTVERGKDGMELKTLEGDHN